MQIMYTLLECSCGILNTYLSPFLPYGDVKQRHISNVHPFSHFLLFHQDREVKMEAEDSNRSNRQLTGLTPHEPLNIQFREPLTDERTQRLYPNHWTQTVR